MKKIIVLAMLLFLGGCSTVDIDSQQLKYPQVTAPVITPMNMSSVNFSHATVNKKPLYTLDTNNMKNLSNNIIEMRRYILSEQAQIEFYKTLSESVEKVIDQHNEELKK